MDNETKIMFERILSQLGQFENQVNQQFKQIDQRFEQVNQQFKQIDQRFEQVDQRFEQVDQRFDSFAEQVNKRFDRLETMEKSTGDHTTQLITKVANMHTDIADVKKSVQRIEAQQALTEKKLNVQKHQIADLQEQVGVLEQNHH